MSKKNYLFYAAVAVLTVVYAITNPNEFISGSKTEYLKIFYLVGLSVGICAVFTIDRKALSDKTRHILSLIMFFLTPLFLLTAVLGNVHIAMLRLWIMNYMLVFILLALFLSLTGYYGAGVIITSATAFFVLLLNTEVTMFRGAPVVPADIFAINTAISVANNYTPKLTYGIVTGFMAAVLWCILAFKLNTRLKSVKYNIISLCFTAVLTVGIFYGFDKYFDTHNPDTLYYDKYDTVLSNKKFGVSLTYWLKADQMLIKKPTGYSKARAKEILDELSLPENNGNKTPNVVVVMNEAFSDLTSVYEIETDKEVLPYFNSIKDNAVRGDMLVSVYGGNTCVTEFEFLTGLTAGNFSAETNAFTQLVTRHVNSFAYDYKALGGKTTAIHPFRQNGWRRNQVYPLIGLDNAIFAENFGTGIKEDTQSMRSKPRFGDYEYVRGYLSDSEDYKKVIEQFENKPKDEKLFVFNVTIQNHGGYSYSGKDFENEIKVLSEDKPELEQYLTLAHKSDEALKELISYFESYDEPTVVVFFGDHQPNVAFSRSAREKYRYLGKNAKYIVPFMIWANYDIEEKQTELTSPVYLSQLMKESCGMELNKWDVFRQKLSGIYPALTLKNTLDKDKKQVDPNEENKDIYNNYKILQYAMMFDEFKP